MRVRVASASFLSLALPGLLACTGTPGMADSTYGDRIVPLDVTLDRVPFDAGDVTPLPDTGADIAPRDAATLFPLGTICSPTGVHATPPGRLGTVIVVMMSTQSIATLVRNSAAPYFNTLIDQCGFSTEFADNVYSDELSSEAHYLALTSGSNCNTGVDDSAVTPGATGCITDDGAPATHVLATQSIFSQLAAWRVYAEGMPTICDRTDNGEYATAHNPPLFYSNLAASCGTEDVPVTPIVCSGVPDSACSSPDNLFTQALSEDLLPSFVMLTPDLENDMSGADGTAIERGDNWLKTYLPLVFASTAYLRGDVAIYVLWDEAGTPGAAMPNVFISPYVVPLESTEPMNLFSALRAAEHQLGLAPLGCANDTPPGGLGSCAVGALTDLRSVFNM